MRILLFTATLTLCAGPACPAPTCVDYLQQTAQRFVDNGNGSVTDLESGLTWQRCTFGQAWRDNRCEGQATALAWKDANPPAVPAAQIHWRLPSLGELATITVQKCTPPRIHMQLFPDTVPKAYWTTTSKKNTSEYYIMDFGAGGVGTSEASQRHYVRLVRDEK